MKTGNLDDYNVTTGEVEDKSPVNTPATPISQLTADQARGQLAAMLSKPVIGHWYTPTGGDWAIVADQVKRSLALFARLDTLARDGQLPGRWKISEATREYVARVKGDGSGGSGHGLPPGF